MNSRKNINRGYQKLTVWQDAANIYLLTCKIFGSFSMNLGELVPTKLPPLIQSTGTLQKVTVAAVLTNISNFSILL